MVPKQKKDTETNPTRKRKALRAKRAKREAKRVKLKAIRAKEKRKAKTSNSSISSMVPGPNKDTETNPIGKREASDSSDFSSVTPESITPTEIKKNRKLAKKKKALMSKLHQDLINLNARYNGPDLPFKMLKLVTFFCVKKFEKWQTNLELEPFVDSEVNHLDVDLPNELKLFVTLWEDSKTSESEKKYIVSFNVPEKERSHLMKFNMNYLPFPLMVAQANQLFVQIQRKVHFFIKFVLHPNGEVKNYNIPTYSRYPSDSSDSSSVTPTEIEKTWKFAESKNALMSKLHQDLINLNARYNGPDLPFKMLKLITFFCVEKFEKWKTNTELDPFVDSEDKHLDVDLPNAMKLFVTFWDGSKTNEAEMKYIVSFSVPEKERTQLMKFNENHLPVPITRARAKHLFRQIQRVAHFFIESMLHPNGKATNYNTPTYSRYPNLAHNDALSSLEFVT